ncbi:AAA family ATPase [Scytonema tolypothrichoides VB-61278]|nr:AAA family ATPase [Scytonema tolypothrichoides VB-61278]
MEIWVNLEFGDGNFECGFGNLNLEVMVANAQRNITKLEVYPERTCAERSRSSRRVQLPPNAEIPVSYQRWKEQYYSLLKHSRGGFKKNQVTHISKTDCYDSAQRLCRHLHQWLYPIQSELKQALPQDFQPEIRLIINTHKIGSQTTKDILHRLPWQEWDFFAQNFSCEAAVCFHSCVASTTASEKSSTSSKIRRPRIISIFGDSQNIDTGADKELLQKLQKRAAELIVLTEPNRSDFNALWEEACDILFFAGHSETKGDGQTGIININPNDSLSLSEIKRTLKAAINKGLKLAIFNSCDGLGLARQLADLNLPYIIVWREEVPDILAQKFLKYFLNSFAEGQSLFTAVGEARDKLKELADDTDIAKQLPGVSWLPIICQNTTQTPPSWEDLGGLSGELPECPYHGLSAFGEKDADFFFGREKFITSLVEAVNSKPLVPVVGASGSGKSSVVFAGLIKHLRTVGNVGIVSFRPGKNPFDALTVALSKYCQSLAQRQSKASGEANSRLAELEFEVNLQHDETALCNVLENIIHSSRYQRLVLVADQFEELYTLAAQEERHSFLNALLLAVKSIPALTLVLTLRADFLGIVLDYQPMGKALQQYPPLLLTPMDKEELRDAIEKPALKMKVELEEGLTSKLINSVGHRPGRLPLLEFALTQLWSKQKNWYLTHKAYEEIGGLEKALAKHADEVLKNLSEEEKQQAQRVFIQLVRPGEGTEDTRRVATRNEVGNENWGLVKHLADERLVVTGWDETEKIETVEIVHEALIREWGTLRGWVNANREFRIWQERLKLEVREWDNHHKHQEALLQGTRLAVAEDWYKQRGDELTPQARDFITASITWRKQEQQKQRRRRQLTVFGLTGGLVVTLMLAGAAWWQSQNSAHSEIKAISESSAALFASNQKLDALREAIRARRKLQKLGSVDADTQNNVELVLRRAVYGAVEYNRLEGHRGEVQSAVFSPDGKTLASTSNDKTVRLWKRDGTLLATLEGHHAAGLHVAISPDGQTLASASDDWTVKLWKRDGSSALQEGIPPQATDEPRRGTLLATLKGHQARVSGVAFSPDGQTLASASDDWTVKLWKVSHDQMPVLLTTLKGHENLVHAVAFSPDGNTIASASSDKTVKLWKRDGTFLTTVARHNNIVWDVAFSPNGKKIVSASGDKTVKLWNLDGKLLKTLEGHQAGVSGVAFSPDGNTIASASWDNTVKLWNKDGILLTELNGHSDRVWKVTFSPDSKILASASADGTIKFWKLDSKLLTTLRGHSAAVIGVAISPDSKMVASASDDGTVKLWTQDSTLSVMLDHKAAVYRVAFSPDSNTIASVGLDGMVRLWNKNGTLLNTFKAHENKIWGVAVSPDGNTIASASEDTTVKLWNKNGTLLNTLKGSQDDPIWDVAFSPDGNTIASASRDMTVKLWNKNGTLLNTLKGHKAGIWGVAFSPDGNTIASASEDKTVKLWKRDGTLLTTLKGHQSIVFGVAFSPDGKILASASADKTIKLWRVETGVLLATLNGHSSKVWRVAFSLDGKKLASASDDKTVILWNLDQVVDLDKVMAHGCDWVRDYLKNNHYVRESDSEALRIGADRTLCDGIGTQKH